MSRRIDKILEEYSLCKNRNCGCFLKKNEVYVNRVRILQRDFPVNETDDVSVNGEKLIIEKDIYLLLNKPEGYVCSKVSDSHRTVYDLIPENLFKESTLKKLHTAGRLDSETSGLIILTTDGSFSHRITSPESHIYKTYRVTLEKHLSEDEQSSYKEKCREGFIIPKEKKADAEKVLPSELEWVKDNQCLLTIHEGKFHQVRRMFLALGNKVIKLKRLSIGNIKLEESFHEGDLRRLSEEEKKLFE